MNSDKYERQCLKPRKDDLFLMTFIVSCAVISNHNNGVGKVLVIYPPYKFSAPNKIQNGLFNEACVCVYSIHK